MNPEIAKQLDAAWFEPADNQTDYTQGFYAGRKFERERIVKLVLAFKDNWQRSSALNFRAELANLAELIGKAD